jgi:hypothetical protein
MTSDNGGPAFPSHVAREQYRDHGFERVLDAYDGMSLRDYFAAQALVGGFKEFLSGGDAWDDYKDFASSCYGIADAMLAERCKV